MAAGREIPRVSSSRLGVPRRRRESVSMSPRNPVIDEERGANNVGPLRIPFLADRPDLQKSLNPCYFTLRTASAFVELPKNRATRMPFASETRSKPRPREAPAFGSILRGLPAVSWRSRGGKLIFTGDRLKDVTGAGGRRGSRGSCTANNTCHESQCGCHVEGRGEARQK